MLKGRRAQALKSILIEVDDRNSCSDLYEYLCSLGEVQIMYHYTTREKSHFALIEMSNEEEVSKILHQASKPGVLTLGSTKIPCFKVSRSQGRKKKKEAKLGSSEEIILDAPIYANQDSSILDEDGLPLNDKIRKFYEQLKIDDLGFRIRFLTCVKVENILHSIDPTIIVLPFGSSVNGFGSKGGDLDMVALSNLDHSTNSLSRETEQTQITLAANLIKHNLLGCKNISPITNARVPIVSYHYKLASLDCDLSFHRRDSIIMSELLYFLATADSRVRPLVFFIRFWAKEIKLTNDVPGVWISNFQLTLLVLFFLQIRRSENTSILPPLNKFFLERDKFLPNKVYSDLFDLYSDSASKNQESLEELLLKFFNFYMNFHYNTDGISVRSGKIIKKSSDSKPLHIENPLSPELNVSRNVTYKEVDRIREAMKKSYHEFINQMDKFSINNLSEVPRKVPRKIPRKSKKLDFRDLMS